MPSGDNKPSKSRSVEKRVLDRRYTKSEAFFYDENKVAIQQERERQAERDRRKAEKRRQKEEEAARRSAQETEEDVDSNDGYSPLTPETVATVTRVSQFGAIHSKNRTDSIDHPATSTGIYPGQGASPGLNDSVRRIKYTKTINVSDVQARKLREAMRTMQAEDLYKYIMKHMTVDDLAILSAKELRGSYSLEVLSVVHRICCDCGIKPPEWEVPFSMKEIIDEAN